MWDAVQARVKLHKRGAAFRYGLMMEPARKSIQPGQTGGEGAGCTSFAALTMFHSGAIARRAANPVWTRVITFGERTIGAGDYPWGSHILGAWPRASNLRDTNGGAPAATYVSAWTYPRGLFDYDGRLTRVTMGGLVGPTQQRQITGYWYDPDYMYFWVRGMAIAAQRAGGTTNSLGRTWTVKSTLGPDALGGYPYLETDATAATARGDWDTAYDPYTMDWE